VETNNELHYNLWMLLFQARNAIVKVRNRELKRIGVAGEESFALYVIKHLGEQATPAIIARLIVREPNTVFSLLNRMGTKGLRIKSANKYHKHMVKLSITEKGEKAYAKVSKRESLHHIFDSLSQEQCQQLVCLLQIIRGSALSEYGQNYEFMLPDEQFFTDIYKQEDI